MVKSRSDNEKSKKPVKVVKEPVVKTRKMTPAELSKWAKEYSDNINDWFRED